MGDPVLHAILRQVLKDHQRMERDKCSCGRGWLADPYSYIDHIVAVYEEVLSAVSH